MTSRLSMLLDPNENEFSSSKKEQIMDTGQYPLNTTWVPAEVYDAFAIVIPIDKVFNPSAEGWAEYRKTAKDADSCGYMMALQLIAEALRNARHSGTRPEAGSKVDFSFRGKHGGSKRQKFSIIAETLVRKIYKDGQEHLPVQQRIYSGIPDLTSAKNVVGIRFFFLAHDENFKFADVLTRQVMKKNRLVRSMYLDCSDDESSDDEAGGAANRRRNRQRGGGEGDADVDRILDEMEALDEEEAAEEAASRGGGAAAAAAAAAAAKKRHMKRKRMTRASKQKEQLTGGPTRNDSAEKSRARLSPEDAPDKQFLKVTDMRILCHVLFDLQTGVHYSHRYNRLLQSGDFSIDPEKEGPVNMSILSIQASIRRAAELGCDPIQCNLAYYFSNGNDQQVSSDASKAARRRQHRRRAGGEGADGSGSGDDGVSIDSMDEDGGGGGGDDDDSSLDSDERADRANGIGNVNGDENSADDEEAAILNARYNQRQQMRRRNAEYEASEVDGNGDDGEFEIGSANAASSNIRRSGGRGAAALVVAGDDDGSPSALGNGSFGMPCPYIAYMYTPQQFTAAELHKSYFPWYTFSREFLEEKQLTSVLRCFRLGIHNAARVDKYQEQVKEVHHQKCVGKTRKVVTNRSTMHSFGIEPTEGSEHVRAAADMATDPMTPVGKLVDELQKAIYHIYFKADRVAFSVNMHRSMLLGTKHMYRVLTSNDERLSDPVLAIMRHMRENNIVTLCSDVNTVTLDLSPPSNDFVRFLLQMETLQIATAHAHIYNIETSMFSAYVCKERTGCELNPHTMLQGPPGTGKSKINETASENLIPGSYENITGRSLGAVINPKSRNCVIEIYDEGNRLYDTPDSKLNAKEQAMKRIEQSAMTTGKLAYSYTYFDDKNKRQVAKIDMEYGHVKVCATNAMGKGKETDAMDDRFQKQQILGGKRKGKNIIDFETALNGPENDVHRMNMRTQRQLVQLRMFLACTANRMGPLLTPDTTTLSIRLAQTLAFLKVNAPNIKFRVRVSRMMKSTAIVETFRHATQMVYATELSPFRRLVENAAYVEKQKEEGTYFPEDIRNSRIELDEFEFDHLRTLGPYLVCPDDVAIRIITTSVRNMLEPLSYLVIYYIALEFGSLDITKVFKYYDEEGENGYKARRAHFVAKENEAYSSTSASSLSSRGTGSEVPAIAAAAGGGGGGGGGGGFSAMAVPSSAAPSSYADEFDNIVGISSTASDTQARRIISSANAGSAGAAEAGAAEEDDEVREIGYTRACKPPRKGMTQSKMVQEGYQTHENIYISDTGMEAMHRKSKQTKVPQFCRFENTMTRNITYSPSYLKLDCSEAQLLERGHDVCRKYNLHYGTYKDVVSRLLGQSVQVAFDTNIPESLRQDADYVRHKVASMMDTKRKGVKKQSDKALRSDHDSCTYLATSLLFESPMRIVQKLAESFCDENTREHTVILGSADEDTPFCPHSVLLKPVKGRKISVPNPKFSRNSIYAAIYTNIMDDSRGIVDPITERRTIEIDDLEMYAFKRHFLYSGYDEANIQYYLPYNLQRMIEAIYYQMEPRMTHKEHLAWLSRAAKKYATERAYAFRGIIAPDPNTEQFILDRNGFLGVARHTVCVRQERNSKLLSYPKDFLPYSAANGADGAHNPALGAVAKSGGTGVTESTSNEALEQAVQKAVTATATPPTENEADEASCSTTSFATAEKMAESISTAPPPLPSLAFKEPAAKIKKSVSFALDTEDGDDSVANVSLEDAATLSVSRMGGDGEASLIEQFAVPRKRAKIEQLPAPEDTASGLGNILKGATK